MENYFGICIIMMLVNVPYLTDYWNLPTTKYGKLIFLNIKIIIRNLSQ